MVYLLTPTGDRPVCLALLVRHVAAQTYRGQMAWIVVDDGEVPSPIPPMPKNVWVGRIRPQWRNGTGSTQAANMRAGLTQVPPEATLLILEDDDVYLPEHVENVVANLAVFELVGERASCYYNVATGRHRTLSSSAHASMASVGLRGEALKALRAVCEAHSTALDIHLWRSFRGSKKLLGSQNVVGIKGMPGRRGIGVGHRATFGSEDKEGVLEQWVGPELASTYRAFGSAA